MISSKYLYPVCGLVLVWAGSLFGIHQWTSSAQSAEHSANADLIAELTNELTTQYDLELMQTQDLLADDSKAKFRPILTQTISGQAAIRDFRKIVQQRITLIQQGQSSAEHDDASDLRAEAASRMQSMVDSMLAHLRKNYEQYDIWQSDLPVLSKSISTITVDFDQYLNHQSGNTTTLNAEELRLLESAFVLYASRLQRYLTRMYGGRVYKCFDLYGLTSFERKPIAFRSGKQTLSLSVFDYFPDFNYGSSVLVYAGDTISASEASRFPVLVSSHKKGMVTERVKLLSTNPLTGEVWSMNTSFDYFVE